MKFLPLIVKNLMRNRRRVLLTVFSMAISLFLFSALEEARESANRALDKAASSPRLVCLNNSGLAYFLPHSYKAKLQVIRHVEEVAGWSYFGGVYRNPSDQITGFASDETALDRMFPDWGITLQMAGKFAEIKTAAMVSPDLMRKYGWKVGDPVMLRSSIAALYSHTLSFTIVGELSPQGPAQLFIFRDDYLDQVERRSPVSYYWIRLDRLESAAATIRAIDDSFRNSDNETNTETERSYAAYLLSSYRTIFAVFEGISVIALVSMFLVAMNTAAMSVRERRFEFAVMRALGFNSTRILALILGESWLMGLLGAILAVACSVVFVALIPGIASAGIGFSGAVAAVELAIASVIGIASGLVPGVSAVRGAITQVLRAP